ncbi:hypothetical protein C1645_821092 [Glomus cerebriforme]|uniref:Uncharacterized protein n=1 Tax=Glomus cerebriforme TaxID=658196 RepID=A0A397T6Y7_9GLOM|nr:hypothetical protein C1645_821092 [Glomus cerebriforme]
MSDKENHNETELDSLSKERNFGSRPKSFMWETYALQELLKILRPENMPPSRESLSVKEMKEIIEQFGPEKFSAEVSDAGANIQNAYKIITKKYPNILNVYCITYAINLISKDSSGSNLKLESQSCILVDCFLELAQLGTAIKKLPEHDYFTFRHQCIAIFNKCYTEFADPLYLLSFFLHPGYKELMHQMRMYHTHQRPFDVDLGDAEFPSSWWVSMEDNFPRGQDYLVQLALKLFAVKPHAAGCERVKQELPYFSIGKSNEEIRDIVIDTHLIPDDDLIEFMDDTHDNNNTELTFDEDDTLMINNVLNLDAEEFIKSLDRIIEDSENNMEEEYVNIQNIEEPENGSDVDWDSAAETDGIIDTI